MSENEIRESSADNVAVLDMDETRTLKWTFKAIKTFEDRGRTILKRMDVRVPNLQNINGQIVEVGQPKPVSQVSIHAGYIIGNYIKVSDILEAAVAAMADISGMAGKKGEPSEASVAIDGYLERGGSITELESLIMRLWSAYEGPSTLQEHDAAVARDLERKNLEQERAVLRLERERQELEATKAQKTSGTMPTR